MRSRIWFIFPLGLLLGLKSNAQEIKDAGLWMGVNLQYNFSLELAAEVNQEIRFFENISEIDNIFTEAGISYKLFNRKIRVGANYRFSNKKQLDDSYSKRHRYFFDLSYREKVKPFVFSYRMRFQKQYNDVFSSEDGFVSRDYWRNRISLKLDLDKKYSPFLHTELFTNTNEKILDQFRITLGMDYDFNDVYSASLFYLHQREMNVVRPVWDYIVGLGITINTESFFGNKP